MQRDLSVEYCSKVYLNSESIIDYLKFLAIQKYNIWYNDYKYENNLKDDPTDIIININWFDENLTTPFKTSDINVNIILSFIHVKGENIGHIINNNIYAQVFQKQILSTGKFLPFLDDRETSFDSSFTYIMYHTDDNKQFEKTKETTILIVNNIKIEWLLKLVPFVCNVKLINKKDYTNTTYYTKPEPIILIGRTLNKFKIDLNSNLSILREYMIINANGPDKEINRYFYDLVKQINQLGGYNSYNSYDNYNSYNIIIPIKDKKYKYKIKIQNNRAINIKKLKYS